ncbi:MAG TPA: fumarylacetoacetate hydrolase family protein [Burkholderiales bacterium]|jgi:2-keto-4-pentenoate hydratase/2-oxohepta-3-ene-1,7-dioic acid hydratase in catechol pathway|nr:fumarylacetoacetate hydrolase family protein [Burkholderiales bacterium]
MKLVTFLTKGGPRAGRLEGDSIVEIGSSLKEIFVVDPVDTLRRKKGLTYPVDKVKVLAPIPDPGLVLSVGMNYHEHLKEMKTPVPEKPAAFTKSVASIIGSGEAIKLPPRNAKMVDWEGEFSVVIGRPCHRVKASQALDYVAGYTLVNDVSARDWVAPIFQAQGVMGPIHAWEHNLLGKMFPTFCPMGPCMVTKDEIADPGKVRIETRLNGSVMQSASTDDLVFGVPQLIEYYSQYYLFKPGDVITTGSPSGVGYGRNPRLFMKAGDVVEVEVKEIGVLRNPVEA